MLLQVVDWLVNDVAKPLWNMFLNGGYIGLWIILFPILRKLVSIMKQFTN